MTDSEQKQRAAARVSALNILARREHSRHEMATKLRQKFPEFDALDTLLDQLEQESLLSDARFAEAFVRSRIRKGQGLYRIRQELRTKGVAEEWLDAALAELEVDWFELAKEVLGRRFGSERSAEYSERAKMARFLQYRGFNSDQIQYALES